MKIICNKKVIIVMIGVKDAAIARELGFVRASSRQCRRCYVVRL